MPCKVVCASTLVLTFFNVAPPATAQPANVSPVTDAALANPPETDWLHWRRTQDGWGYSPLDQITRENVGQLQMVWSWALGTGTQQTTPLVHDGVMYLASPGNVVHALDATTGRETYRDGVLPQLGVELEFCPSHSGFKSWRAMAYSPETKAFYIPLTLNCQRSTYIEVEQVQGGGDGGHRVGRLGHDTADVDAGQAATERWRQRAVRVCPA